MDVIETNQSIAQRFEDRVRRYPARQSISGTQWQPSFAQLDAAASQQAHGLLERGGQPGDRIALLMRHDAPLFAAALGVLKAGRTGVVLNSSDPPARLDQIRADVEPEVVITDARNRELALLAGFLEANLICVDAIPVSSPHSSPAIAVHPDALAFLIYTSGSTGGPKGVMQSHRTVLHNVLRNTNGLGVLPDDRIASLASLSGGRGLVTAWTGLLNGATLCPFPIMERGFTGLPVWFAEQGVTVIDVAPSVLRGLLKTLDGDQVASVRLVALGSEPATRDDLEAFRRHFAPTCRLAHVLGSSEAGVIASCAFDADATLPPGPLPVGWPAEGAEILLLDEDGTEVKDGERGEIVVRSEYLSPGYWRQNMLTSQRFVREAPHSGRRRFHTGDLGYRSSDGALTVLGRRDNQVKIRGFRVELAEVEATIGTRVDVDGVVVRVESTPRGDTRLTAYVVRATGRHPDTQTLRQELRATLPEQAVPTSFVFLDAFPVTPHGKIDRQRLALLGSPAPASDPSRG